MRLLRLLEADDVIRLRGFGSGGKSPASQYIELFKDHCDPAPPGRDGFMIDDVIVELGVRDRNTVVINNIQSLSRGYGQASKALKELIRDADELGITLALYASAYSNRGLTLEQLISWYERNGFVADSKYHSGKRGVDMIRPPR